MANLPFMLGAAAGAGLIYLFKKNPAKFSKKQPPDSDSNNTVSKPAQTDTDNNK